MELGDGVMLARQFVANGWLGPQVLPPLQAPDALLESMSGPDIASLWEVSSLNSSPRMASTITSSSPMVAGRISLARGVFAAPRMRQGLLSITSSATAVFMTAFSSA